MNRQVLILANSRKHSGRCVAGKTVLNKNWIRITKPGRKSIPCSEGQGYTLGSVWRFSDIEECPSQNYLYHSEDCSYKGYELINPDMTGRLEQFLDRPQSIFLNNDYRLSYTVAQNMRHSLVFVHVEELEIYCISGGKIKCDFLYNNQYYQNISVTTSAVESDENRSYYCGNNFDHAFLTLSLGEPYQGYAYKLVSGLFIPE